MLIHEILNDQHSKNAALSALKTTERAVTDALRDPAANFSLCHGLAGNADILLEGKHWLPSLQHAVNAVATQGGECYALGKQPWPCGCANGRTPGLMLGTAGIGYFYLRVHDPMIPSVLSPGAWRSITVPQFNLNQNLNQSQSRLSTT